MKSPQQLSQEIIDIIKATGNYFVGNTSGMSNDGTVNVYHPKGYSISAIAANPISSGEVIVFNVNGVWYAFGEQRTVIKQDILIQRKSRAIVDNDYPVITLFGRIRNNSQTLGIGTNQLKKQLIFSNNSLEVETDNISGYITNNGKNKYSIFYQNILPSGSTEIVAIVNKAKSIINIADFNGIYIGDNVWVDGKSKVVRSCVLEDYSSQMMEEYYPPVEVNYPALRKTFPTYNFKFFGDGGYCEETVEQLTTEWDEIELEGSISRYPKETYRSTVSGTAVILRFKDCVITQELGLIGDVEFYGYITLVNWGNSLTTVTQNRIYIVSPTINTDLNIAPLSLTANLDQPGISDVVPPVNVNIGTTFSYKYNYETIGFNGRDLDITTNLTSPIPIMMAKRIDNTIYLIKAQANLTTTLSNNGVKYDYFREESLINQNVEVLVSMVITSSKKILTVPSFGLNQIMPDTGSFHVFHKCVSEYYGYGTSLSTTNNYIEGYSQTFPVNFQRSFDLPLKKLNFIKNKFYFVLKDTNHDDSDFTMEHTGKFVEIWNLSDNGDIRFETIKKFDSYPDTYRETDTTSYRFHSASYYPVQ